jgi:hypothetical protein
MQITLRQFALMDAIFQRAGIGCKRFRWLTTATWLNTYISSRLLNVGMRPVRASDNFFDRRAFPNSWRGKSTASSRGPLLNVAHLYFSPHDVLCPSYDMGHACRNFWGCAPSATQLRTHVDQARISLRGWTVRLHKKSTLKHLISEF